MAHQPMCRRGPLYPCKSLEACSALGGEPLSYVRWSVRSDDTDRNMLATQHRNLLFACLFYGDVRISNPRVL
jgi:hypothetical protein